MKQPIHIIYLSGFGIKYDKFRLKLLRKWRFRNVTVELVSLRWEGNESFEQKVARVDQAIDRVKNKRVALIGESAGGSMALHMYARRPDDLYRVMTICGKNAHPETVGDYYYRRSPAFRTAMDKLKESTTLLTKPQRQRFVSIHPLHDSVVPVKDTLIADCTQIKLWSVGHLVTIFFALTIFAPIVVKHARK